jgi:F-box protein 7
LVVSVHEAFLESGLVGFDPVSRTPVDGLQFPEEWPSSATPLSLSYTLPELLEKEDVSESIVLNIRRLINNGAVVSGSSAESRTKLYLTFDQNRFAPVLDLLQTNCLENDRMSEVNEFWKASKDQHVMPLSI